MGEFQLLSVCRTNESNLGLLRINATHRASVTIAAGNQDHADRPEGDPNPAHPHQPGGRGADRGQQRLNQRPQRHGRAEWPQLDLHSSHE